MEASFSTSVYYFERFNHFVIIIVVQSGCDESDRDEWLDVDRWWRLERVNPHRLPLMLLGGDM